MQSPGCEPANRSRTSGFPCIGCLLPPGCRFTQLFRRAENSFVPFRPGDASRFNPSCPGIVSPTERNGRDGFLSAVFGPRVVLSVVPLTEIEYIAFMIFAMLFYMRWIRSAKFSALLASSVLLHLERPFAMKHGFLFLFFFFCFSLNRNREKRFLRNGSFSDCFSAYVFFSGVLDYFLVPGKSGTSDFCFFAQRPLRVVTRNHSEGDLAHPVTQFIVQTRSRSM